MTTIDSSWLEQNRNPKAGDSGLQRVVDYAGKSSGSARMLGAIQKTARLGTEIASEVGLSPSPVLKQLDVQIGIGMGALGMMRLPSVTSSAIQSLQSGNVVQAIRDTTDAAAVYGNAVSFITGNPVLRPAAQTFDLVSDIADFPLSVTGHSKVSALLEDTQATGLVKEALTHSKDYYFWRTLKNITSIATAIFGFVLVAAGIPPIPTIAFIILALVANLVAIRRDLHLDLGQFNVIQFDGPVKLGTI